MPTTTWILEAAEDRYLEATAPMPVVVHEVELTCPFCERSFPAADAQVAADSLARHIAREHPLLRPVLIVGGKMLGPNSVITRRPSEADVVIENATLIEIGVDGDSERPVSVREAAQIIGARPRQMLNVRLANERVEDRTAAAVEYRIRLDVADEAELDRVDELFLQHLARDDARREDVTRFSDETDGLANFYRDGLASYVLGVFAKDQPATADDPQSLERALAAFGRAAFHLADFRDRRVAAAVAACASLNLNDIGSASIPTGLPGVDAALGFLRHLRGSDVSPQWPKRPLGQPSALRCPVDDATFAFLDLVFALGEPEGTPSASAALERIEHGTLTAPDRTKFAVVLGEWASRTGRGEMVRRCASILYNDPIFEGAVSRWKTA